jgi:RHS repeat-associated protein
MGSQRIASSLINRPYRPPGWGEPAPGEEPVEGEDGYNNPPLENGYSELSDGLIVDMQATIRELFDNPDLEMNEESFYLQSLGDPIEFNCSPASGAEYEGGESGSGESEYIDPLCACEQSLSWATEAGYDCQTLNVIYFYHPDYLGSVEYVTDMRGNPYQFFLNTPWGDRPFRNKPVACFREGARLPRWQESQFARNYTAFSSRFRFNDSQEQSLALIEGSVRSTQWEGRTLRNKPVAYFSEGARLPRWQWDEEPTEGSSRAPLKMKGGEQTGNFYYGARYYDPKISVWLSVDPLSREFPHVSPYNFSLNSPINLVDADEYRKGSSGESGNGWTLNNSLRLGAKIKVFGQKVSLGINLGQIGLTFSRLSQGVVIYIYDF